MASKRITDLALLDEVAPDDLLLVRDASAGADKRIAVGTLLGEVEEIEPSVTFATPGDLSVEYGNERSIKYVRRGSILVLHGRIQFTPTFTTASGNVAILGLPALTYISEASSAGGTLIHQDGLIYPSGRTSAFWTVAPNGDILLRAVGDGAAVTSLTASQIASGVFQDLRFTGSLIVEEE